MEKRWISRRRLLKGLGLTSAATFLTACAQPTPTAAPKPTEAQAAATSAPQATIAPTQAPATQAPPTKVKITYALFIMSANDPPADEDSLIQKTLEERFNIDLDFIWIERSQAKDIYATRFAADEIPDIFLYEKVLPVELYDQGVVAEVPYATIKQYAPKYFQAASDYSIIVWLACHYKGKNMGLPQMAEDQLVPFTDGWRLDSLEKIGFSQVPETIDEFEEAMVKMVEQQVHEYAVLTRGKDAPQLCFASIFGAYGTFPCHWIENPDKSGVTHGIVTDGAREALTTLQGWYKKGLIHPESLSSAWQQVVNTWCQGKTGFVDVGTWYRLYKGGELYDCIVDAGGKVAPCYAPKGPRGEFGYHGWGYATQPIDFGRQVANDPDKLAAILKYIEGVATDKELAYFVRYGKEGEHSERDEHGVPQLKADVDRAKLGSSIGLLMPTIPAVRRTLMRSDFEEATKYARAGSGIPFIRDLGAFMDASITSQLTEEKPTRDKWEWEFITGAKDMSQWDAFLKEWNEKGGKALTEEANRAYKEMNSRIEEIKAAIAKA